MFKGSPRLVDGRVREPVYGRPYTPEPPEEDSLRRVLRVVGIALGATVFVFFVIVFGVLWVPVVIWITVENGITWGKLAVAAVFVGAWLFVVSRVYSELRKGTF